MERTQFSTIAGLMLRARVVTDDEIEANDQLHTNDVVLVRVDTNEIVAMVNPGAMFDVNGNLFDFE